MTVQKRRPDAVWKRLNGGGHSLGANQTEPSKAGQKLDTGHCKDDFLDPNILPGKINEKFVRNLIHGNQLISPTYF